LSGRGELLQPIDRRSWRRVRIRTCAQALRRVFAPEQFHLDERAVIDPIFKSVLASDPGEDSGQHPPALGRIGDGMGPRRDVRLGALLEVELEVGVRDDVRVPTPQAGRR
jgi:hypothetical protein